MCLKNRFAVVFFAALLWLSSGSAGWAQVIEINAPDLKKKMDTSDILVVFPLSPIEFDHIHIPGSVNIPMADLVARLPADKNRPLAFYCLGRT